MLFHVGFAALVCLAQAASPFTHHDVFEMIATVKADHEDVELLDNEVQLTIALDTENPHDDEMRHEVIIGFSEDTLHIHTSWEAVSDGLEDFPHINAWNAAFAFCKVSLIISADGHTYAVMHMDQLVNHPQDDPQFFGAFVANAVDIFKTSVRHFDYEFTNYHNAKAHAEEDHDEHDEHHDEHDEHHDEHDEHHDEHDEHDEHEDHEEHEEHDEGHHSYTEYEHQH